MQLGPQLTFFSNTRLLRILRVIRAFRSLSTVTRSLTGLSVVVETILQVGTRFPYMHTLFTEFCVL